MGNVIQAENARAGTSAWQLTDPITHAREIEGYCGATSVNRGGLITWHVNCAAAYTAHVYRMGHYGGLRGRLVVGPLAFPASVQAMPVRQNLHPGFPQANHGVVECNWTATHTLHVPANDDWPSGIYVVKLEVAEGPNAGRQAYMIFCVRDDARTSEIVYVQPVSTYCAYNTWGGKSLYSVAGDTTNPRYGINYGFSGQGRRTSFNRPYTTVRHSYPDLESGALTARWGVGAGEFFTTCSRNMFPDRVTSGTWESDTVAWLEQEGYDVRYITSVDHEVGGVGAFAGASAVLCVGHDEYHTQGMRDSLLESIAEGRGMTILSANFSYWRIRFEPSLTGVPNRTVVGYKEVAAAQDPDPVKTGLFRTFSVPEGAAFGVQYKIDRVSSPLIPTNATHWVFEGTGAVNGVSLGNDLVGYEFDELYTGAGRQPAFVTLCVSPTGQGNSTCGIYQAPSGAWVFSSGTMQIQWGLSEHPYLTPLCRPSVTAPAVPVMIANVLSRQGAEPGGGEPVSAIVYDLEYRPGTSGAWTPLAVGLAAPAADPALFLALPAASYQWRVVGRDSATGHTAPASAARTVVVPAVDEPPTIVHDLAIQSAALDPAADPWTEILTGLAGTAVTGAQLLAAAGELGAGSYRWRVTGRDADTGDEAPASVHRTFGIASTAITGSGAGALSLLSATATGTVALSGNGAADLGQLTATGAGVAPVAGDGAAELEPLTTSGAGAVDVQGDGAATLGALTTAGSGTVTDTEPEVPPEVTGSGMATLGALAGTAAGTVAIAATGAADLARTTAVAVGAIAIAGDGLATLAALDALAAGGVLVVGLGGGALSALTASGAGTVVTPEPDPWPPTALAVGRITVRPLLSVGRVEVRPLVTVGQIRLVPRPPS